MIRRLSYLIILLCGAAFQGLAQQNAIVYGRITDTNSKPLELVNIVVVGTNNGTRSDKNGNYELQIPAKQDVNVAYSFIGFHLETHILNLNPGSHARFGSQIPRGITASGRGV